ncbi:hypothetical protein KDW_30620 [Dictyobacter vulcani]|uniref:IstB-like ATP-binding domain-containing protein n=1 Tax=Dictyobacter vulcani TaxID=2607529 RepID=A0A5J4KR29_9CHLR|nr:ATP-binding protein [Dictyobacter vulcani]GER88900.1 hypothetical protein KDW_30620 [Dictyobacter vulcani]
MDRLIDRIQRRDRARNQHNNKAILPQPIDNHPIKQEAKQMCPHCNDAGYLRVDVPFGHPDFGKPVPCHCHVDLIKQKKQQKLIHASGLNTLERFRHASFHTYNPFLQGVHEAYTHAFEFANQPTGWLALIGEYGCGKTHLAVSIAKKQLEAGKLVVFQIVPRLLDDLRATFSQR